MPSNFRYLKNDFIFLWKFLTQGKEVYWNFEGLKIGCVEETYIIQLMHLLVHNDFGNSSIRLNELIVEEKIPWLKPENAELLKKQCYQIHQSDNQKKGILRLFQVFLWSKLGHESLLFKQGFPQKFWISASTQFAEHPNFGLLMLRKVSHSWRLKITFLISSIFLAW